ncbi:hypothetical protein CHELA20_50608 [Hyphomicrobiales bacterium]|nr:hypothetical protein CHELA20_50608 [Hyphomicrobiales bacterium]CAH1677572.1 hypothetical protein CHELA41_24414 [Hyphomicrobiales bacterium]
MYQSAWNINTSIYAYNISNHAKYYNLEIREI